MAAPVKQYKLPITLEEWQHISVTWEDILTHNGPCRSDGFKTITPCVRRTTGYVIVYNDEYLVVATTDDRESQQGDHDCEDATQIPIGNIRRILKK